MAGKVKTWVWVVVAIAVVGILGLVTIAGVAFYFVSRNIETKAVSATTAAHDFDSVRAEYQGQKPLIELDTRGHFVRANTDRAASPRVQPPTHLNVMAFDPAEGRVVRFRLPFWLLRLKMGNATIDLNGNRLDLEDLKLSVDDLERYGPALIVDHQSPGGERVLVWSR